MNEPEALAKIEEVLTAAGVEHSQFGSLSWTLVAPVRQAWEARARILAEPSVRQWVLPATLRPKD